MTEIAVLLLCVSVICAVLAVGGIIADFLTNAVERSVQHDRAIRKRARSNGYKGV